jgi:beta-galactosidase
MIETPHRSSLRPVLAGEFDMAYSPLLEMTFGSGRLILCTLDFENRNTLDGRNDPVADKLAVRLLEYAAPRRSRPSPPQAKSSTSAARRAAGRSTTSAYSTRPWTP